MEAAATSTQMNVRLDARLKCAGDAALANAGYTPSAAVRALWSYAAAYADAPQAIHNLLANAEANAASQRDATAHEKAALVAAGPASVAAFYEAYGIPAEVAEATDAPSYDDVLFEALTERECERHSV